VSTGYLVGLASCDAVGVAGKTIIKTSSGAIWYDDNLAGTAKWRPSYPKTTMTNSVSGQKKEKNGET